MEKKVTPQYFDPNDDFVALIQRHFAHPTGITQIQTGWTNFVYQVTTAQDTYYFRFPRNDFFAKALLKEHDFLQFIQDKVSFTTPHLQIYYDQGRPYSLHQSIAGETLTACYRDLTLAEKQAVAADIVAMMHELAQIDWHAVPARQFEPVSHFLDALAAVSQNNYDLAQHDVLRRLEQTKLVCCHGDLNPGNIILRHHRFQGVLDFAFAGVSTSLVDLSRMVGRTPSDFAPLLINAYEQQFHTPVNQADLTALTNLWRYVEEKYILYIKQNHPSIILPDLV